MTPQELGHRIDRLAEHIYDINIETRELLWAAESAVDPALSETLRGVIADAILSYGLLREKAQAYINHQVTR